MERDRKLQNRKDSNIPPISVKQGQVLYMSSYDTDIDALQKVQQHLMALSSKEKEVVYRVLQRDTSLQYEIAKDIRLLPVQSLLIMPIFNWSIDN